MKLASSGSYSELKGMGTSSVNLLETSGRESAANSVAEPPQDAHATRNNSGSAVFTPEPETPIGGGYDLGLSVPPAD
jgi:hypothetical protein